MSRAGCRWQVSQGKPEDDATPTASRVLAQRLIEQAVEHFKELGDCPVQNSLTVEVSGAVAVPLNSLRFPWRRAAKAAGLLVPLAIQLEKEVA